MIRKAIITGLLIFFKKGSIFQLVVAMITSLGFLSVVAWFQPYVSRAANLFKVATEVALLITLILCVLLKLDTGKIETEIPGGMDALGSMFIFVNSILPGGSLVLGILFYGFDVAQDVDIGLDEIASGAAAAAGAVAVGKGSKGKGDDDAVTFKNPMGDGADDID
jgi:hypothetical protein